MNRIPAKRLAAALLTVLVSIALPTACKRQTAESNPDRHKITLSVAPFQDTLLPLVAQKKGFFAAEGLDVEIQNLPWYSAEEHIANGSVQIGMGNIASVVGSHHNFPAIVYAYGWNTFDNGFSIVVRPNSGMKSLSDFQRTLGDTNRAAIACMKQLKGKSVVTTGNTDMAQVVSFAVRNAGLTFGKEKKNDVRLIDLEPDEGLASFLNGTGDAYLGGIPQRTRLLKEHYLELISGPALGPVEINGFITTKEFADQHRDDLISLLRAIFKTIDYTNNHVDDSAQIVVDELNKNTASKFTKEDFRTFWQKVEHYTASPSEAQDRILSPSGNAYWKRRWDACNYYFLNEVGKSDRIPGPVDPDGVFLMPEIQREYIAKYGPIGANSQ